MKNPLISIHIPVYNREQFIGKAIDSILKSSYKNFELIIVNDGSIDNSEKVILSFNDNRIKYIKQDNKGCWAANNQALKIGKGDYFCFIGSDDYISTTYLEEIVLFAENNPLVDYIYPKKYIHVDKDNVQTGDIWEYEDYYGDNRYKLVEKMFYIGRGLIPSGGVLIKKAIYDKYGLYKEEQNTQDFELVSRLALSINFKCDIDLTGYFYRIHNTNISKDYKLRCLNVAKILDSMLNKFPNETIYPKLKEYSNNDVKKQMFYIYVVNVFLKHAGEFVGNGGEEFLKYAKKYENQIGNDYKMKNKTKIAFIAQNNNFNFMHNILYYLKQHNEIRVVDSTNEIELNEAYLWADIIWLEWADELTVKISNWDKRCKIICRLHSYEVYLQSIQDIKWENIDTVIFVSNHLRDYAENRLPELKQLTNTIQISEGIDLNKFVFKERSHGYNLAFVGNLTQTKNIALLLQILKMLVGIDNRYKLHVFGNYHTDSRISSEIPKEYFEHQIKNLNLKKNIILYGHVTQEELIEKLKDVNYILSTSYREGVPFNLLEAMAMGIKPIIHNWPGAEMCFGKELIFDYIGEIPAMLNNEYNSLKYRTFIGKYYNLKKSLPIFEDVMNGKNIKESDVVNQDFSSSVDISKEKQDYNILNGEIKKNSNKKSLSNENMKYDRKLNILFVQNTPCIRNYKYAKALKEKGHRISLAFTQNKLSERYPKLSDDVYFDVIKIKNYNHLLKISKNYDLIHSHNEPDTLTVVAIQGETPVIHDTHDLISLRPTEEPESAFLEAIANQKSNGRIYTTNYQMKEAKSLYGIDINNSLVFNNYASKSDLPAKFLPKLSDKDRRVHLVYEGGIGRNLHREFPKLLANISLRGIHVHIYPAVYYKEYVDYFNHFENVHYYQPISPKEIMTEMTQYDIGIIPWNITKENKRFLDSTIANKLFEYLAAGLPVATSPVQSYVDYFEKNKVGTTFETVDELVEKLPMLMRMSKSIDFTKEIYTYEKEIHKVEEFYYKILKDFQKS